MSDGFIFLGSYLKRSKNHAKVDESFPKMTPNYLEKTHEYRDLDIVPTKIKVDICQLGLDQQLSGESYDNRFTKLKISIR